MLKAADSSVIIDCGSFYDEGDLSSDNSIIDKKLINADAMVLTHAHNDHSGRILQLISEEVDEQTPNMALFIGRNSGMCVMRLFGKS